MEKNSIRRFREIVKVFAKYGFGYIFDNKIQEEKKSPANLRKAFEELGPTFIKIGQILSTRPEIIGEEYSDELAKLQNQVPTEDFEKFNEVFYNDFGKNLKEDFKFIDETPLASASIAQVYIGILKSGEEVVIKIQRPHIKEKMIKDFDILISISEKFKFLFKDIFMDPKEVLLEIKKTTEAELNFINESENIKRFKELNKRRNCISAPFVIDEMTSNNVLTLEHIEGFKITDVKAIDEYGYDKKDIAKKLAISYFKQVFSDGFFHADPHPGNILIREGKIYYIDFGMVGVLSNEFRERLNEAVLGMAIEDIDKIVDFVIAIGLRTGEVDRDTLYEDINYLYSHYINKSFSDIKIYSVLQELLEITKRNNLRLPSECTMLFRSMMIIESIIADLDPTINMFELVIPYVKDNPKDFMPKLNWPEVLLNVYKTSKLPNKLVDVTDTIINGRTKVNLKVEDNCRYMDQLNKMVNRLSFALIVAGMVVGSSIIINSNPAPRVNGVSIIGIAGYLVSAVFALWLLISIIRSGSLK